MSMDKRNTIEFSHEDVNLISMRKLTHFDTYSVYNINDILSVVDTETNNSGIKIMIIEKKKLDNYPCKGKHRYFFLIYTTDEEERLLKERLRKLGYI